MEELSEERQHDHGCEGYEGSSGSVGQPPERVPNNGKREALCVDGLVSRLAPGGNQRTRSVQERMWVAVWKKLARALPHLGTDECEFRVQFPWLGLDGDRLPRESAKPAFESKRGVKGDGGQPSSVYRTQASLT